MAIDSKLPSNCPQCGQSAGEAWIFWCLHCGFKFFDHPKGACSVNGDKRLCYVPISKNASSGMTRLLRSQGFVDRIYSEEFDSEEFHGYFCFCVWREPITRFLSGYAMNRERAGIVVPDRHIPKETLREDGTFMPWDGHVESQSWFIEGMKFDFVLRCELLEDNLGLMHRLLSSEYARDMGFAPFEISNLGRWNAMQGDLKGKIVLDDEMLRALNEYYEHDIAIYNDLSLIMKG